MNIGMARRPLNVNDSERLRDGTRIVDESINQVGLMRVSGWVGAPRRAVAAAVVGILSVLATTAADRPARLDPGVSFRISTSTKVYPGDTPRAQDDEVMRGRGVAVNGRARIEFLT